MTCSLFICVQLLPAILEYPRLRIRELPPQLPDYFFAHPAASRLFGNDDVVHVVRVYAPAAACKAPNPVVDKDVLEDRQAGERLLRPLGLGDDKGVAGVEDGDGLLCLKL